MKQLQKITGFCLSVGLFWVGNCHTAFAESSGNGYFQYDKLKLEVKQAYAFRIEKEEGKYETFIYLTNRPIDAAKAANAFNPESNLDEQFRDGKPGGYVRICVRKDGGECGLYFYHREPSESFNTSGSGEFKLTTTTPKRLEGSWIVTTPQKFFEKTYEFSLKFAVDVTEPDAGTALPAGGGEPGKVYLDYITAIAKGDFATLRKMLGEGGAWQFPEDDLEASKESLKSMRDGTPVTANILSGVLRNDEAVLQLEGVDRDEIKRKGRVLMKKRDGHWYVETTDLRTGN